MTMEFAKRMTENCLGKFPHHAWSTRSVIGQAVSSRLTVIWRVPDSHMTITPFIGPYLVCLADSLRFALMGLDPYGENPDTHGIWLVYDATAYGCQTGNVGYMMVRQISAKLVADGAAKLTQEQGRTHVANSAARLGSGDCRLF